MINKFINYNIKIKIFLMNPQILFNFSLALITTGLILLFKGLFSKHYRLMAISLVVIFLYGGMLWYIFPVKEKMSWEGHLSGFITGFIFALIFNSHTLEPELYAWESEDYDPSQDPFLQQFDSDGNFIESSKSEISSNERRVNYTFKSD